MQRPSWKGLSLLYSPGASMAVGLFQLDLDLVALLAHRVGLDCLGAGRRGGAASLDVEPAGVQRTLDLAAVEPAVGEFGVGVGADVVGAKERPGEIVERDLLAGDRQAEHIVGLQVGARRRLDPAAVAIAHLSPCVPMPWYPG